MPAEVAPSFVWVPDLPSTGARLTLPEDESHYVTRVCRGRPGDRLSATDGRGALATLRLVAVGSRAVAEVESCERMHPERSARVLSGAPQGERGDWMVEKLAELGVTVFQPLDCERGRWERMKGRMERWRRLAIAALRQSRRRFLFEIRAPVPLAQALAELPSEGLRWVADSAGTPASLSPPPRCAEAAVLIGPSGGFSPAERERIGGAGVVPIALSDGRLRTETAAMAWACWWSASGGGSSGVKGEAPGLDASAGRP